MAQRAAGQADGVAGGAQVAAHEREVAGLDGDVGAGAHGEAEVGLGEGGGVVDAVADHRHDRRRSCRRRTTSTLSAGSTSAMTSSRSMPTSAATVAAARWLSPVSSTGRRPSARSSAIGAGARRLDGVGDDEHARGPRRPSRRGPVCARPPRRRPWRRAASSSSVHRPVGEEPLAAGDDGVAVDDAGDAEALRAGEAVDGGQLAARRRRAPAAMARAIGCSDASSSAPASRSTLVAWSSPVGGTTSTSAIAPVVTVPVLSSTIVSTRRVDSSTSGPLMRMPSWAPRPVPTMSAVGVARPRAHGQAMISTATAAVNADGGRLAGAEPEPERGDGEGDDDRHEHGRDPVGEALHRRLAGLGVLDEPGDLGQLGVGADPGGPHDEPAAGVDGGTGDGVAGADLDGHRLAGEQRGVDGRRAVLDDAVGGDLLARAHDEAVADGELVDRDAHLGAVAEHGDVLGAELEQRPQRGAGAALGPGLEVAAGEDERRHAGGDLEVDHAGAHRRARRVNVKPWVMPGHAGVAEEQRVQRPAERGQHAERDERVHRRRGVAQVGPGRPVERPRAPGHDRGGQRQRQPLPVLELQRRDHRQQHHRHRQDAETISRSRSGARLVDGFDRSSARRGRRRGRPGVAGRVAGRLDLGDEVVDGDRRRRRATLGLLGGVVDRGRDAVELVEALLDAGRARRARHAADDEVDAATGVVGSVAGVGRRRQPPCVVVVARQAWRSSRCRRRRTSSGGDDAAVRTTPSWEKSKNRP